MRFDELNLKNSTTNRIAPIHEDNSNKQPNNHFLKIAVIIISSFLKKDHNQQPFLFTFKVNINRGNGQSAVRYYQ